jgi:hypothetical protein
LVDIAGECLDLVSDVDRADGGATTRARPAGLVAPAAGRSAAARIARSTARPRSPPAA